MHLAVVLQLSARCVAHFNCSNPIALNCAPVARPDNSAGRVGMGCRSQSRIRDNGEGEH